MARSSAMPPGSGYSRPRCAPARHRWRAVAAAGSTRSACPASPPTLPMIRPAGPLPPAPSASSSKVWTASAWPWSRRSVCRARHARARRPLAGLARRRRSDACATLPPPRRRRRPAPPAGLSGRRCPPRPARRGPRPAPPARRRWHPQRCSACHPRHPPRRCHHRPRRRRCPWPCPGRLCAAAARHAERGRGRGGQLAPAMGSRGPGLVGAASRRPARPAAAPRGHRRADRGGAPAAPRQPRAAGRWQPAAAPAPDPRPRPTAGAAHLCKRRRSRLQPRPGRAMIRPSASKGDA